MAEKLTLQDLINAEPKILQATDTSIAWTAHVNKISNLFSSVDLNSFHIITEKTLVHNDSEAPPFQKALSSVFVELCKESFSLNESNLNVCIGKFLRRLGELDNIKDLIKNPYEMDYNDQDPKILLKSVQPIFVKFITDIYIEKGTSTIGTYHVLTGGVIDMKVKLLSIFIHSIILTLAIGGFLFGADNINSYCTSIVRPSIWTNVRVALFGGYQPPRALVAFCKSYQPQFLMLHGSINGTQDHIYCVLALLLLSCVVKIGRKNLDVLNIFIPPAAYLYLDSLMAFFTATNNISDVFAKHTVKGIASMFKEKVQPATSLKDMININDVSQDASDPDKEKLEEAANILISLMTGANIDLTRTSAQILGGAVYDDEAAYEAAQREQNVMLGNARTKASKASKAGRGKVNKQATEDEDHDLVGGAKKSVKKNTRVVRQQRVATPSSKNAKVATATPSKGKKVAAEEAKKRKSKMYA